MKSLRKKEDYLMKKEADLMKKEVDLRNHLMKKEADVREKELIILRGIYILQDFNYISLPITASIQYIYILFYSHKPCFYHFCFRYNF